MTDLLNSIHLKDAERKKHRATIELLTAKSGRSKAEIGELYEAELERAMSARIRDFLPILIARRVKQELRARRV